MRRRSSMTLLLLIGGLMAATAGCGDEESVALSSLVAGETALVSAAAPVGESSVAILTATSLNNRFGVLRRRNPLGLRAIFAVHSGAERAEVLELLDLPPLLDLGPTDRCVVSRQRSGAPASGWVDLLDAGAVDFQAAERRYALEGQEFPGVVPDISGVTYAGSARRAPLSADVGDGPFVRFEGAGSGEVGPFSVEIGVPAPTRIHAVDGRGAVRGRVDVAPEGDLDVRWDESGSPDEQLLLELSRSSFGTRDVVRCVVVDDGRFTVPGELRAQLPAHAESVTEKLTVRRIVGSEFYASGVDEGWAFFISEDFVILD